MSYAAKSTAPAYGKWALTEAQCQRVISTKATSDVSTKDLAKRFGVSDTTIRRILYGSYTPAPG